MKRAFLQAVQILIQRAVLMLNDMLNVTKFVCWRALSRLDRDALAYLLCAWVMGYPCRR